MNKMKHVLVVGGSGLVGYNVAKYFAEKTDWKVTTVSRRRPTHLDEVTHISIDLFDELLCADRFSQLKDVTHIVYAAYYEKAGTKGWKEPEQMEINKRMLQNVLSPIFYASNFIEHVTLIQGTKAYGDPLAIIPIPAKEKSPRAAHDIFYWLQEDWLKSQQLGKSWSWTILRPQIIFGESLGSHMNMIPAIGVYAAILKSENRPLHFPGGASWVREAVDANLLAKACEWAGSNPLCRNEIFNITNGDVFEWRNIWPSIADALGMTPGSDKPLSLASEMHNFQHKWQYIVQQNKLSSPADLESFVGQGFAYADRQFCYGMSEAPPVRLVSTIKAREAGFTECIDTELMFRKCFSKYQELNWLPPKNMS